MLMAVDGKKQFADDNAVSIFSDAPQAIERTSRAVSITHATYVEFGLSLNYTKGKSETIFGYFGPVSRALREHVERKLDSLIRTQCAGKEIIVLDTDSYKHLGTQTSSASSMAATCLR